MNTVINSTNTIMIKNSKFISVICQVNSLDDIDKYLKDIKEHYKCATHYCYAYIVDEVKKSSDDGEPGGTAGNPILQVLEKNNLNYTLCVVVRYFGGIKLGSGGLVRAYSKSAKDVLNGHIKSLIKGYNITIVFNYKYVKQVDYIIKDEMIINKSFGENIIYNLNTTSEIIDKLNNITNIKIDINYNTYI